MSDLPYAFFHPRVVRTERLSPTLLRIVLGGEELSRVVSGGHDQRFKLFLPHPGQDAPVLPEALDLDWYARWRALDPEVRGIMRTYTIRDVRRDPPELDVDFALHGDLGPASRWAGQARPGDRLSMLAPAAADNGGVDFRPPEGTDRILLTADETALPAVASILSGLPQGIGVKAWIEVPHSDDRLPLVTKADAEITWLIRTGADRTTPLLTALAAADLPPGTPYAWLAGESAAVRAQRRHLVADRGFDRKAISFTGYWRQGATEDELLETETAVEDAS
ncbi:NADPH-dependent ferric siderophore reductase, contains FAD-binding and SIP domains [Streptomyces sp. DvalAA-14]|uniref:siderophore-interacting protein n=1 Tax=unclassified Streptomyces TaxID=2593676 RepID=UPI00081B7350|nr:MULTISPECIES: siderophore-interacting protein [unclassified Streptomyces]MYS22694.1 SIP domain-containing protein [Streptomyces sp. SID4948]SCE20693.1 NADPH-dependent ferric siderophore reductase, contains FAD-binding and SIP domains [Streptomyces sp. DvalAA-14]